ncbi:Vacuolar membrane protein [Wickerhamomyces ciferrii]|uniref:E3 ubiquitin-protein ligase PEP5 n=1 Tax=Wickerhamomyces ciferrii (strain ATCC 14091 / BCRC 22168 / CBS 111 / JCM 3599 / NBRC 0793 / NRRL Y-1031 F-60-10) TaxID=1206466 RepID=K0KK56_WICCF|nr:Vacuolar membrane protein [Wickerhamomyces ciferrii]CCH41849.1 Vacuolar membrane protein [Wickerhamomyces ciferrii]
MSWRQFQFFESIPIRDPSFGTEEPLYSDPSLTAICPTPDYLLISTSNYVIKFIDKDLKLIKSFSAYQEGWSITYLRYVEGTDFFVSVAERQGQPSIMKLWSINKIITRPSNKIDDASYHTMVHVKNGNNSYPLTSFTFASNFSILAFGYANGNVVLVRGDLLRDRGSSQTIAYKSSDPITGLEIIPGNNYDPLLYITTTAKIITVPTIGGNHSKAERWLEKSKGADLGTVDIENDNLIVGRTEGLVFYDTSGASYTISLDMPKKKIHKFGKYILIVTSNTSTSSSLMLNGYSEPTKIIIADIEQKLISFTYTIASTVNDIFALWGDIFILSTDGILYKFHEKDLEEQLGIVVKRDLYQVAIDLAKGSVSESALLDIKRKYGDYLYSKNETTEAMDQYIQTLSLGNTSEVIKKYKDSKEVQNLARFLEEMLNQRLSTKEHVTLLLCTYCKLKDVEKLNVFIDKYDTDSNDFARVDFDLDIVVELCRETNLLSHASRLAQNSSYSSLAVDILLRDLHDSQSAIQYIKTLPVEETLRILVEYARLLLESIPNATTALLIDVFTGKYKPDTSSNTKVIDADTSERPVLLQSYKTFVSYMSSAANTLTASSSDDHLPQKFSNGDEPTYQPPKPRIIFPSFVNRPNEFVIFLEACAESFDKFEGDTKDKKDILNTLYELYLTLGNGSEDENVEKEWENKAVSLVKENEGLIDSTTILLISNIFDFDEGQIAARNGPGFEIDLFRSCVAQGDVPGAVDVLNKYGEKEPELYPLALMFYTSDEEILEKVGPEKFKAVLDKIKNDRILTPLEIIQALSVNKVATIELVKDYILEFVETEKREIEINEKLIKSYKEEAEKKRNDIHVLESTPTTIQPSNCDSCSNKLDSETVYFLCHHSYHKHCLAEVDKCPKCTPARETVSNIREGQRVIGERNDLFNATLQDSDNRFKVVTDFFGKGAMDHVNYFISND